MDTVCIFPNLEHETSTIIISVIILGTIRSLLGVYAKIIQYLESHQSCVAIYSVPESGPWEIGFLLQRLQMSTPPPLELLYSFLLHGSSLRLFAARCRFGRGRCLGRHVEFYLTEDMSY